jgi:sporulation protein YlmC with PRC-barrel domain
VHAEDGIVGKVDEFLVSPNNNHITHLVLREGHLWGKKDVTIPVSEIEKITEDAVYLKLDKKAIEKLPAIPVKRLWL